MVDELAELIVSVGETKSSKDKYNGAKVGGHTLQKVEGLRAIKKIWDKAIKEIEKGKKEKEKGMKCLRCGGRDFKEYDPCFDSKTGFSSFKVGDRVNLVRDKCGRIEVDCNPFWNGIYGRVGGTVRNIDEGRMFTVKVEWDNGNSNSYDHKELQILTKEEGEMSGTIVEEGIEEIELEDRIVTEGLDPDKIGLRKKRESEVEV